MFSFGKTVFYAIRNLCLHFLHVADVSDHNDPRYVKILEKIEQLLGEPRNYGPTPEEKEEIERAAAKVKMRKEAEERAEKEKQEMEEESLLKQRQEEWVNGSS